MQKHNFAIFPRTPTFWMRGVRTETCPRWPSPAAEPGNHRASIRGRAAALRSGSRVCILRWHRVLTPTLWPRVSSSPWRGHVSSPRGGEVHVNPACESWVGVRRRMFFLGTHTTQIVCQKKRNILLGTQIKFYTRGSRGLRHRKANS